MAAVGRGPAVSDTRSDGEVASEAEAEVPCEWCVQAGIVILHSAPCRAQQGWRSII